MMSSAIGECLTYNLTVVLGQRQDGCSIIRH